MMNDKKYLENKLKLDESLGFAKLDNNEFLSEIDLKMLDDVCKEVITPNELKDIWIKEAKDKYGI